MTEDEREQVDRVCRRAQLGHRISARVSLLEILAVCDLVNRLDRELQEAQKDQQEVDAQAERDDEEFAR